MEAVTDDYIGFTMKLKVSPHLVGSKFAVQFGDGPTLISPAMHDLLTHATGEELVKLLAAIPLRKLPDYLDASDPVNYEIFRQ